MCHHVLVVQKYEKYILLFHEHILRWPAFLIIFQFFCFLYFWKTYITNGRAKWWVIYKVWFQTWNSFYNSWVFSNSFLCLYITFKFLSLKLSTLWFGVLLTIVRFSFCSPGVVAACFTFCASGLQLKNAVCWRMMERFEMVLIDYQNIHFGCCNHSYYVIFVISGKVLRKFWQFL